MGSDALVLLRSHPLVHHSRFHISFVSANPSVRPWGPHDFLTVFFQRNSASRLMALRKHQKQPENPIGILFYVPYLSAARLRVKTAEFGPEKLPPLFTAFYGFWAFPKWCYGRRSSSRFKSYEVSKFKLVLG